MGENLVEKAKEIYKDIPIDASSLETYVKLMQLQKELQATFEEKYSHVDVGKANSVLREGKPAFLGVDLGLNEEELGQAMLQITGLLKSELPDASQSLERLEEAWKSGQLSLVSLGESLLTGDVDYAHAKAEELRVDHEVLEAVTAWVMQVLFQALASQLSGKIDLSTWTLGRCPVCGGSTRLEIVDSEGSAHLKCQFCGTEWGFQENKCPYCGNESAEEITSIPADKEGRFTLNICHVCGRYWKVVDERKTGQAVPRKLYDLWTFKLDLIASGGKTITPEQ